MPNDPFYSTQQWKQLRLARLRMDHFRCAAPGCGLVAVVADHVVPRRQGGSDTLSNLRSLCLMHDRQVKERIGGSKRGHDGQLSSPCDVNGHPLDPKHPWFKP